jgi:hypothetical protein
MIVFFMVWFGPPGVAAATKINKRSELNGMLVAVFRKD